MDAKRFVDDLLTILDEEYDQDLIRSIKTFEEVGMLTRDAGLVVTLRDRSEFQVTVVQSRHARE